jgi:hypothetical protein
MRSLRPKRLSLDRALRQGAYLTRRTALFALPAIALLSGGSAKANDTPPFKVIVHPGRTESAVPRQFLVDAFLKNVTRWRDDEAIKPVDQRIDSAVRKHFSDSVLRRSVAAVKAYWQQRIFSGRGVPPPALDSDEAVVEYVIKNPGAVGYVSGTATVGKAKVVTVNP